MHKTPSTVCDKEGAAKENGHCDTEMEAITCTLNSRILNLHAKLKARQEGVEELEHASGLIKDGSGDLS